MGFTIQFDLCCKIQEQCLCLDLLCDPTGSIDVNADADLFYVHQQLAF